MGAPTTTATTMATTKPSKSSSGVRKAGMNYARKKYEAYFAESSLTDKIHELPSLSKDQLVLGKALGKGNFGTVYEVRGVGLATNGTNNKTRESAIANTDECRFLSDHCLRDETGDARYAIKTLNKEVLRDDALFIQGTLDMAIETRVLSDTEHPNIIKARALAIQTPFESAAGYFIMMDRLYDTLGSRLKKWQTKHARLNGIGKLWDRRGLRKQRLWEARIVAAFDLSDALGYLHRKNIVYRDLKPENIGFDVRDDVKLFDFGLAGELTDRKRLPGDLYKLTAMTGSPRYMAPEVANGLPYNETCDVYSFSILCWEILALKTPFEIYTMKTLKERVWNGIHKRPLVDKSWPEPIRSMLANGWSKEIADRPGFSEVTKILRHQCVVAREGDDKGLNHDRRRSTFVFAKTKLLGSEVFSAKQ